MTELFYISDFNEYEKNKHNYKQEGIIVIDSSAFKSEELGSLIQTLELSNFEVQIYNPNETGHLSIEDYKSKINNIISTNITPIPDFSSVSLIKTAEKPNERWYQQFDKKGKKFKK